MSLLIVNTAADTIANDGRLSLREAVDRANATAGADTIRFAAKLEGKTLTLTGGELALTRDVTIDGDWNNDGKEVTLSGAGISLVLQIGTGTDVNLRDLGITEGLGGINVDPGVNATLRGCTVSYSSSYAIGGISAQDSHVEIIDSAFISNNSEIGGGIKGNGGELVVQNSLFAGNDAKEDGSAIFWLRGQVTIEQSAFNGNITGPIYIGDSTFAMISRSQIVGNYGASASSAGIVASRSILMLADSTLADNSGRVGAIHAYNSDIIIRDCTITNNSGEFGSGGIQASGSLHIANSIVAGNFAGGPGSRDDISGAIAHSNGRNIFGSDVAGATLGDLQGIAPSLLFASLDPETGGGKVSAAGVVPLRNSIDNPALSDGDPLAALPTDQIGTARPGPGDSLPDIGAAERNQALSTSPSNNNDVLTGTTAGETISAGRGADLVRGLAGNDTMRGEAGSDVLDGGLGNDLLDGGDGIDLARLGGSSAWVIDLVAGTAKRGAETDTLSSIQGAIGSSAADSFTGDGGPNWFQGGGGRDVATGGAARDLYDFDRVRDSLPGSANRDVITDLALQSDRIDLTGIDADMTRAGNQAFRFVHTEPLTGPGQLGYRVVGSNTIVRASTDADAAPEFEVQLNGLTGIGCYVFYL